MRICGLRLSKDAVSPVIAVILMVAITVVLAGVVYVWVMGMTTGPGATAPKGELQLKDASEVLDDAKTDQNITLVDLVTGDKIRWSEIRIMVSANGDSYVEVKLDETVSAVVPGTADSTVYIKKLEPLNVDDYWEPGETIVFREGGNTHWNPGEEKKFYVRIVHTPSGTTICDENVDVY